MARKNVASRLLTHRQRGFDAFENTVRGLSAALAIGVPHVEIDVRKTKDNHLIAHHDPFFVTDAGPFAYVNAWTLADLRAQRALSRLATVEEMVHAFARADKAEALLYLDLKIAGEEERVAALLSAAGILERSVIVSWSPGVIERFHQISPTTPVCFCHLSLAVAPWLFGVARSISRSHMLRLVSLSLGSFTPYRAKEIASVRLFFHADGNPRRNMSNADLSRCFEGHAVPNVLTGRMRQILKQSRGMVCLPRRCTTRALVEHYRAEGIKIAVYSVKTLADLRSALRLSDPDMICVDDADLIRALMP